MVVSAAMLSLRALTTLLVLSLGSLSSGCSGCDDDPAGAADARLTPAIDAQPSADAPVSSPDAALVDALGVDATEPDAMQCSAACPTPTASSTADPGATGGLAVEAINIARGRIVLRNLSDSDKTITDWFLCFGLPDYLQITKTAVVPANGQLTLVVGNSACGSRTGEEVCVSGAFNLPNAGEFGLFETDTYTPASEAAKHIRGYVRWGASDAAAATRQEAASLAGLWPALSGTDDFLPLCSTHDGFVATGDVTDATGFVSVDASCF